ncbi:MAG: glycosyltransferase family 4 protein [Pirellulales bacterium]|nr:glycosyltransferase family 4 protein [Pirellulales bacterium]
MKILVVTNLFHPDRGGGASVFSDMCYGLVERGHAVTVYGAYPYYPEWQNKSGANLRKVARETIGGVEVHRFGMYLPRNPSSFVPRVAFELSFMFSLLRSLFYGRRFDVVMTYCPVMGAVAYSAVRKLFYREPTWLNVQDIPADAAAASGISRSRLAKGLGQFAQSTLFNRADVWSTIAPKMVERLSGLRRKNQPLHFVPNFLNQSMEEAVGEHPAKLGRNPADPIKLLYAGNIGKKQGLLEFCQRLQSADLRFDFRIHGNGGEAHAIRDWVAAAADPRFAFGDFLDERGFVAALMETDFFVITEKSGVGASFIPSKLIPCIATATPLLCVCDAEGPLGQEVAAHGLGVAVPWTRFDELRPRLEELLADPPRFVALQQNALNRAQTYGRGPGIDKVERELAALAGGAR